MVDRVVEPTSWGGRGRLGRPGRDGHGRRWRFVLPAGTVAFLLTDVEGSTRLWESSPTRWPRRWTATTRSSTRRCRLGVACGRRRRVRAIRWWRRFRVRLTRCCAAADAQRALTAEEWPTSEPLRVRMAVHAGEARTISDGNYAGQAIVRAARLRAIAHGGQVLVSGPARDLVVDHLGDQVRLVDLGEHRLRDLARPERVFQVIGEGLLDGFEPLRSLDAHRHNLPVQLSSFIGRVDDIATVADLVRANRLVTIVGAGGAGKTRLAQQAAAELVDLSSDGTWWVELQDVRDPNLVVAAIGSVVGARADVGEGAADALAQALADQHMLIVLDNCEHVIDAAALVVDRILRGCPHVRVLATSREAARGRGEVAWRIPRMGVPAADGARVAHRDRCRSATRPSVPRSRSARPARLRRRRSRTPRRSRGSAIGSTAFRLPSSSPPPGAGR